MKTNKIIGISVATLGVALSIGAAFALYKTGASPVGFGIGAAKYTPTTGDIQYLINDDTAGSVAPEYLKAEGDEKGTGIGGVWTQVHYSFKLGAQYPDKAIRQNYILGNFSISLTGVAAGLQNNMVVWAEVTGYDHKDGDDGYTTLGYRDFRIISNNLAVEGATFNANKDICVATNGTQTVELYIKVTNTAAFNLLSLDEGSLFNVSVAWTNYNDFNNPYVVGAGTDWSIDNEFEMVPNINYKVSGTNDYEWYYNGIPGSFAKAKCAWKGSDGKPTGYSSGEDATLTAGKTYSVTWQGGSDQQAYFVEE